MAQTQVSSRVEGVVTKDGVPQLRFQRPRLHRRSVLRHRKAEGGQ